MRTTRSSWVSALLCLCLFLGCLRAISAQVPPQSPPTAAATAASTPAQSALEQPIRDLVDSSAKAYSAPDINALAAFFADEANVVDSAGESTRGKPAVVDMYASSFEENPSLKLEAKVEEIRFLTPEVARVEGQTRLSTETGDASDFTRFSSLLVKRDGKCLVAEIREYALRAEDVATIWGA